MDNLRGVIKRIEADLPTVNNLMFEANRALDSDPKQAIWHLQQVRRILDKWIEYLNSAPTLIDVIED